MANSRQSMDPQLRMQLEIVFEAFESGKRVTSTFTRKWLTFRSWNPAAKTGWIRHFGVRKCLSERL